LTKVEKLEERKQMASNRGTKKGDVFQITDSPKGVNLLGCLVMTIDVSSWGIQAEINYPDEFEVQNSIPVRLEWSQIEHVGLAPLIPKE
jgi:hypothetical protein